METITMYNGLRGNFPFEYNNDGTIRWEQSAERVIHKSTPSITSAHNSSRVKLAWQKTDYRSFYYEDNIIDYSDQAVKTDDNITKALISKSLNDQFKFIHSFFGLTKTEWAEIFSVSRVAIYGWLKEETKPTGNNAKKIASLFTLINSLSDQQKSKRMLRGFVHENITEYNKSLFEILSSTNNFEKDYPDMQQILTYLLQKSSNRFADMEKYAKEKKGDDSTVHYNLKNLKI